MPSASAAAAADGTPAISTPDALSGGQTRPEPHAIPDPSVPTADTTMVDVDVPPTAAVAGSPKPLRHIMSDLAPNAKGFDSRRPDGGIAASGLWLSPQLTTALHNLLLGPADHSTATAARSKDCGRPVDRPSPHHSTETPTRTVPKADTAPHEPVGFLEALLKPISDEEAAELVAAASNHPIARLAAAFKPQLLNYRPPPIARAPQLPEFLPAVRLVRAGPSSQGDSLRGTGAIGPSALCTSASTPREPNGETRRPVYEVGQRPKGQSIHQNASGNPTSPAVAVGARQPGCVAADHGQEVLELLSDDSASEPGGDRRGGHSVGRGNGGPDDGFDPDRLVMTLDVVPLAARKPTGHVARAKRDSTTRVSGWPSASKHSKLKRAGRAASASPRPQEAVAAVAATPATADDDDRLEDMPLAARKRLSAAAAAVATAAQPSPPSERDRKPAALAAYTSPGFCPNTSPENRREFNRGKSGYALHGNGPIEDRSTHQLHSAGPEAAGSCQPEGQVLKQGWQATPAPGAGEIHSVVGAGLGAAPGTGSGAPPHLFPGREAGDGARLDASSAPGYWPWDVQEGSRSREPLLGAAAARQPWQHAGQPFHGNDYSTDQRIQSPHQHQHQHHVYHAQDKQMQIPADAPPSQRQLQQRPLQPQQQHQQQSSGWQPQHQDSGWQPPPLQPPQQQQRNISWQQQPLEPPQQQQKSGWQPPQQQEQQQTSGWQHQPLQQPHQAQPQKTSWQQQALQRQQQQQKSDWQQQPQQPLPSPPQQQRQQQQQEQQQNSGWQQEMLQPPPPPQQQSSGWQPPPLQPPQQQQGQQQKSGWQQEMLQPPPPPQQQSSGWQPPPLQPPQQQQEQQQISCWQQEMLQPPPQQQQQSPGWQPPPLQPPQQQQEQQQKSGWQQEMLQPPPQQQQQQSSGWQPPPLQPPQQQQGQQQKSGWQQMLQPPPQQQQQQNYGWQPHRINVMAPATVQEQKQQQQQLDALAPGLKRASAGGSSTVHDATADPITAAAAAASPRMARELWATEDEEEIYIPATPLSDDGVELAHQCTDIGAGECARRAGEACAGSSDNVIAPVGSGGGDHAALPSPIKPRQLQFPAPTPSPNGQLLGPTATNLIATPGLEPELQPERASLPPWLALQARQQQRQQLPLPKRQAHDLQGGKPEAVPRSVREQQKVRGDAGGWTCGSESAGVDLCLMTGKRVLPVPELSRPPDAARQQGQQQRLEQQQMGESAIATRRGEPPALSHGLQKALDAMAAVDDNDGGGGDWSVVHADGPGTITAVRSAGDGSGAASATAVISPVAGPVAFQGAAVAADVATGSGDAPAVGTGGGSSRIHGNLEDGQAAMGLTHLDDQEHLHEPDSGLDDWLLQPWHQQKRQPEQSKGQDQQLHPPPEARRYQVDRSGNGGSGGSCRISNSALSFGSQFLAARPREHERLQQLTGVVPETPGLSDLADAAGEHGEGDGGDDNGSADCKAAGSRPSGGELASRSRGPFAAFAFHAAAGTGTGAGGGPSGASFRAPTAANITPIMRARLQRRTADAARPASGPTAATAVAAEEADVPPPPFTIDLTSSPPPSCERRQSAVTVAGHQENTAHVGQCPLSATSTEGAVVTRRHLCTKAGAAAVKRRVAVITDDSSQEPGSVRRKPAVDGKAAVGGYNNCAAGSDSGGSSRGSGSLFKKFALTPVGPAAGFGAAAAAGTRTPGIGDNPNGSAGGCGGRDTTPLVGLRRRVRRPVRTASDDGAAAAAADGDPGSGSIRKPRKLRRLQAGASGAGGSGFGATARCQHAYGRDGAATMTGDGSKAGNAPTSRRPAGPPAAAITAGASIAANRTRLLAAPAEAAATEGARPAGTIGGARGGWRRGACSFIDAEAALSGDEEEGEEGEEGEEEGYESSFVTDGSDGELAGGSQSEDAGARSPGSMMAIYRAPFLATQAPPSVVRPGDVAALVFAQRRRRRGGVPAAAQKGFPKYGKILDTPGASADLNDSVSDGYGDDQSDGEADEGDQSADGEGEEDEEDEEGDDEDDGEDPLVRRMARGLDITRDGLYRRDSGLGRGGRGRGEGRGHDHHGLGSMRGAEDEEEAGEEGEGEAESDAGDDDVCGVCGEHGHLMVCEGCDSCVHPACVGLQAVPEGDWFCKLCRPQQRRPRGLGTVAGRPRSQGGCGGVGKGSLSEGTGSRR
ncbi:hypothetical protein Vretifemale_12586 [Volvox reticuliferus]|nr:hypothetical protein Vretifemale_12586 [Volvox reticuliferus]